MEKYENILGNLEKELRAGNSKYNKVILNYLAIHRCSLKDDFELINCYRKDGKILDIGSAPFHLVYCLKKLGYDITGVDINPSKYSQFIRKNHLAIKRCDVEKEKLPFKNNRLDIVTFNDILEHLRINPVFALKEINRILKPGGIMILRSPNAHSLYRLILFNLGLSYEDPYMEFEKINHLGYMGHIRVYSTREIKRFLEKTGFKVKEVEYTFYNKTSKYRAEMFFKKRGFRLSMLKTITIKLGVIVGYFIMKIMPRLRPSQVIISTKRKE